MFSWLPAALWAALIFGLSAQPDLQLAADPHLDFVGRKLAHMTEFGILATLIWRASEGMRTRQRLAGSFAGAVVYAVTDEFHQALVAGRHATAFDVAFDAVGAVIALFAIVTIASWRRARI